MVIPNERKYVIIDARNKDSVVFSDIAQDSESTLRYSLDGLKVVIKYDGSMPQSLSLLTKGQKEYTHDEILAVMRTPEWEEPDTDPI